MVRKPGIAALLLGLLTAEPAAAEPPRLEPGARWRGELAGGRVDRFRLELEAGWFARVAVRQRTVDVVLGLLDADGALVQEIESLTGRWGTEIVSVESAAATAYVLEIRAAAGGGGAYELEVGALRPVETSDRRLLAADRAMTAAYRLYRRGTAADRRRAIDAYRQVLESWRLLGDRAREAETLYAIAVCFKQLGEHREALDAFHRALDLHRARGDDLAAAATVHQVGIVQRLLGRPEEALASYRRALELWHGVGDLLGQGLAANSIGYLHHRAGRLRRASVRYQQALAFARRAGDESREIVILNNLATVYQTLGEPELAAEQHHQVLAKARELGQRPLEAKTLNNLGYLHRYLWEPQQALTYYRQALELFRQLGERKSQASTLHNLGSLYHHLGRSQRGRGLLEEALALRREVADGDGEARTLTVLGEVRAARGETAAAAGLLERALELRRELGDADGEAVTRAILGGIYAELGDLAAAGAQLDAALAIEEARQDRLRASTIWWRLGTVRAAAGAAAGAAAAYERSLALATEVSSDQAAARALRSLGRLELDRGRLPAARGHLEAALDKIESSRTRVVDPELRSTFFGEHQAAYELYVEVLMRLSRAAGGEPEGRELAGRALIASERARARTLIDLLAEAGAGIRRGVDPELAARRRRLGRRLDAKALEAMTAGEGSERWRRLRSEIQELLDQQSAVEAAIRAGHPRYGSLLEPRQLGWRELQGDLLDPGTMLLEIALGSEGSYLWALTATDLAAFPLPPRAEIEARARTAYELLSTLDPGRRRERCRALAELGETILGPVAARLDGQRLVVVPDGVLHYLPFAAFATPGTGGDGDPCRIPPLVESHEIVTLPSAATLLELRSWPRDREPAPRTVAVLADPVFQPDDPRVGTAAAERDPGGAPAAAGLRTPGLEADFTRLAWSRREARAIVEAAGELPPGAVLEALGFAAGRAAVGDLGDYRFIHFATHGVLDSRHPELSGLVLSLVDEAGRSADGVLRLHDIYNLDLRAELVVLSGCRTALGREIRGEGLVGLTRGFFYAGAERVVASLWRIDDRATAELMGRFYREILQRKAAPAAALRAAQRWLRRQPRWRDPYYWAAFTAQGEWRQDVR